MLISGGYTTRFTTQMRNNQTDIKDSLATISSGERILHAGDDPAGLAIATGFRVRIQSRDAAIRNTESGLNMTQVADEGLTSASHLLRRMRELAVQSASETISDTERAYVQLEFATLLDELDRMSKSLVFGSDTVLSPPGVDVGLLIDASGSMNGEKNQVQASIQSFIDQFIAARYNVRVGLAAYAITKDSIDNVDMQSQLGAPNISDAINNLVLDLGPVDPYSAMTETVGITSIAGTEENDLFQFRESAVRMLVLVTDAPRSANLNGLSETEVAEALSDANVQLQAIAPTGVMSSYDDIVTETGGASYDIGNSAGSGIPAALTQIATAAIDALNNNATEILQIGPDEGDLLDVALPVDTTLLGLGLDSLAVDTVQNALTALDELDVAIDAVGGMRSTVGAAQRRLTHILEQNISALEAEVSAESTISDRNLAIATTELAAAQIQQQGIIAASSAVRQLDRTTVNQLLG